MLRICSTVLANLAKPRIGVLSNQVKYGNLYLIKRQFNSEMVAEWPDSIKNFLGKEKIEHPTPIQEKTLPLAMESKDIVGIARTGSGKTLAFVIPAVMKILKDRELSNSKSVDAPSCLVLAPTRELANQIADVFKKFRHLGIHSIVLVGGSSRNAQIESLQERTYQVYIATPGRLQDLINSKIVDLSNIKYLVLDEADRMLDMGFEPQIRNIIQTIPTERQTLMWSATWPSEIQELAKDFMRDHQQIAVDSETLKANPNIKQIIDVCSPSRKFLTLIDHLQKLEKDKSRCLIFVNTKRLADNLMFQLMKYKIRAISLHGDRSQRQRDEALRAFKQGRCSVMIATDVAARGLDIDDISLVINYDLPTNVEDYIHRIGRTARGSKAGTAISLFTERDANIADKLVKVLRETSQEIPRALEDHISRPQRARNFNFGANRAARSQVGRSFRFEFD